MKCIEAKRMVTRFVNKELPRDEAEQFLHHVEHCEDCMEELDIYYTMYKAFDMLDAGTHHEYDFKKMLVDEIHAAKRKIVVQKIFRVLGYAFVTGIAMLLLIWIYNSVFH